MIEPPIRPCHACNLEIRAPNCADDSDFRQGYTKILNSMSFFGTDSEGTTRKSKCKHSLRIINYTLSGKPSGQPTTKQESSMVNEVIVEELNEQEIELVAGGKPNNESNAGIRG